MPDVTATLKDAAYVTVGLGVLGFQKAQVRRVELQKQLEQLQTQLEQLPKQLEQLPKQFEQQRKFIEAQLAEALAKLAEATKAFQGLARDLDARIEPVREQVGAQIDAVEGYLPEQVRDIVKQARAAARERQTVVRSRLGLTTAAA
jgi:archaellum component FlaC